MHIIILLSERSQTEKQSGTVGPGPRVQGERGTSAMGSDLRGEMRSSERLTLAGDPVAAVSRAGVLQERVFSVLAEKREVRAAAAGRAPSRSVLSCTGTEACMLSVHTRAFVSYT